MHTKLSALIHAFWLLYWIYWKFE